MQLVKATSAIATNGLVVNPRLVLGVNSPGEKGLTLLPDNINDFFWKQISDSMKSVVHEVGGTAWRSGLNAKYNFAGKTGTAQVIGIAQEEEYKEEEIPEELQDHALFIAFAPVEAPEIAVAIIVENGGGGSKAAAPIARKMFDNYFTNRNLISNE